MSLLPLPIAPADALSRIVVPASALLPSVPFDDRAHTMLLTIALQEGGRDGEIAYRQQIGGPARGPWMFEQGGGVHGVMTHPATAKLAAKLLARRGVPHTERSAYLALAGDDLLACGFARLLLWADPDPLPSVGARDAAWAYYRDNWRPGHPRPEHWAHNYQMALSAVGYQHKDAA